MPPFYIRAIQRQPSPGNSTPFSLVYSSSSFLSDRPSSLFVHKQHLAMSATRLFVQILRMLRTSETEIGELLSTSPLTREPPELVRQLCQLQLDVIADVTQYHDAQLLTDWRIKIIKLWHKYMDEQKAMADDQTANGHIKPLIDLEPTQNGSAIGNGVVCKQQEPKSDTHSSYYAALNTLYSLFRKLCTPEWVVDSLLSESVKHPPELMAKLAVIEKEVALVPQTDVQTIKKYCDHVVALWSHYITPPPPPAAPITTEREKLSKSKQSTKDQQQKSHSGNPQDLSTERIPGTHFSKAVTCTLIERIFDCVQPIYGISQVEEVKSIINSLGRAIKILGPFKKDEQVQQRAVAFVLPILPVNLQAIFRDRCERRILDLTLRHLKLFLCDEMAGFYAQRVPSPPSSDPETTVTEMTECSSAAPTVQTPPPASIDECSYCKQPGHNISNCTERQAAVCYKCNQSGHIAKHCPSRADVIRSQLSTLFERIDSINPEDINLNKLAILLERADKISQPMWRDEALQREALDRVLPKLSNSMRDRFLIRCHNGGKRITIRELKSFIYFELKHPFRAFEPPLAPMGGGTGGQQQQPNTKMFQQQEDEEKCTNCKTTGHRAEQCVDMMQMLGMQFVK